MKVVGDTAIRMNRRGLALLLVASMCLASQAGLAGASPPVTYATDVTWSGSMVLTNDVVVSSGATLTIEAGTDVEVAGDHSIRIEGDLVIEGTSSSPSTLWGSWSPPTSDTVRWEGFVIASGGVANVGHLEIEDARGGFSVLSGGALTVDEMKASDVIIGIWAQADVTGTLLHCERADNVCLLGDADVDFDSVRANQSAEAVRVTSTGDVEIPTIEATNSSLGLSLHNAQWFAGGLIADDVGTAVQATGATDADFDVLLAGNADLVLDATDVDGLVLDVGANAGVVVGQWLRGTGLVDLDLGLASGSLNLFGDWAVDAEVAGELRLSTDGGSLLGSADGLQLSGEGTVVLDDFAMETLGTGIEALGTGVIETENGVAIHAADIGSTSGFDTDFDDAVLLNASDEGLVVLGGAHDWADLDLARPYASWDTSSVGVRLVWASLNFEEIRALGWHESVRCEADCTMQGESLTTGLGGRTSGAGLVIDGGDVRLDTLGTQTSDRGIVIDDGNLHLGTWTGQNHVSHAMELGETGTATIRFMPGYATSGAWEAFGDGSLTWGSNESPRIAVSTDAPLTEAVIQVQDASLNNLPGLPVTSHGFEAVSDANGEVFLPVLTSGSEVCATDGATGIGTCAMLAGDDTLIIPLMPTSGAWTIPAGQHVRLAGGDHAFDGDVIVRGTLVLVDAELTLASTSTLIVESPGAVLGEAGQLSGGTYTGSLGAFAPIGGDLIVNSSMDVACEGSYNWSGVFIEGDLSLSNECWLGLIDGSHTGELTHGTDSRLTTLSELTVRVLDKGETVTGALVGLAGEVQTTDDAGLADFIAEASVDDAQEGISETGVLAISIQHANVTKMQGWDPATPGELDVMISTLDGGMTTGWVRLEPTFSPYHLGEDLTVAAGTTLELRAGSTLAVAADAELLVDGDFLLTSATLQGTEWDGLTIAESGTASLSSGHYMGAPIKVEGSAELDDMLVSGARVHTVGGDLRLTDGMVHQNDMCLGASSGGTLTISGTTLRDCDMHGVWVMQATLEADGLILSTGNTKGIWLQDASGALTNFDASAHDGDLPALHLQMMDGDFRIEGADIGVGTAPAGLLIEESLGVEVLDSIIRGAPGTRLENTGANLTRVDHFGSGTGTAISVAGTRNMQPVRIVDCDADDYAVGISLAGTEGDLANPAVQLVGNHWHSDTAILSVALPFHSYGEVREGAVEVESQGKEMTAHLVDGIVNEVDISGPAKVWEGQRWTVRAPAGTSVDFDVPEVDADLGATTTRVEVVSGEANVDLFHRLHLDGTGGIAADAIWRAAAPEYVDETGVISLGGVGQPLLEITMEANVPPNATITLPNAENNSFAEGDTLVFEGSVEDPDNGGAAHEFSWMLLSRDDEADIVLGDGNAGEFELFRGNWDLELTVTDRYGSQDVASLRISVTAPDNDGDFSANCHAQGQNAWYDVSRGYHCGPDAYDDDDDNDQILDTRDAFPFDACASHDFDLDGRPDTIRRDCETTLVEDDDDDDDGVLDSEDLDPLNPEVGGSGVAADVPLIVRLLSPQVVLTFLGGVILTMFILMRRKEA